MNEIKQMSEEEYFKAEGLSNSYLILFNRSPMHAKYFRHESKSLSLGSACHSYLYDDSVFSRNYIIAPDKYIDKESKKLMDIVNHKNKPFGSFCKDNPDYDNEHILLQNEYQDLYNIKSNLLKHKINDRLTFEEVYNNSKREISFFWTEFINGIEAQKKGRADLLYETENECIIFDYKSTQNCLDFHKSVSNYKYYRQAAWYIEGITKLTNKPTRFIFLPFETKQPFGVQSYELHKDYLETGHIENTGTVKKYLMWQSEGNPEITYAEGTEILFKPTWL